MSAPRREGLRVRHGALHFFVRETLKRVRVPPELASHTADALVAANLWGEDADGVAWLPDLVAGISARHLNPAPEMRLAASSGGVAVLDGGGGPGPAVGRRAMTEAIALANRHGVGSVAVRRSNRLGAPGHFAALALPHQMAGVALAGQPDRAPAADAPAPAGPAAADPAAAERGTTQPAPVQPAATDPVAVGIAVPTAETAPPMLLNLRLDADGSDREFDREFALGLALEFLLGLAGAALPAELAAEARPDPTHRGTGHLFLAFRIRAFAPWAGFRNRMVERLSYLRRARLSYPGQEAAAIEEERRTRGIPLDGPTAESLQKLAYGLALNDIWDRLGR